MEQYSRRNCLVVHGIPETKEDSSDALLHVFNGQLNVLVAPTATRPLSTIIQQATTCHSEVREL